MTDHLIIFDTQLKPETDLSFCSWFGNYILEHQPDKLKIIGDWWDMPSLSSYDKNTRAAEGRNYSEDIAAGCAGMAKMLGPFRTHQLRRRAMKKAPPQMQIDFMCGNHEYRIQRHLNANPYLEGQVGYFDFNLIRFGATMHEYLQPHIDGGIQYVHCIKNRNSAFMKGTPKPLMQQTMMTTIVGHQPGLQIHTDYSDMTESSAWVIMNGSSYPQDEDYRMGGGNSHFRGIAHLRNVSGGDFDLSLIRMKTLEKEYS